jgi:predicted HTH domain antitoxin
MGTITLQVPDQLGEDAAEMVNFIAIKLYEAGKLSLEQAADMCSLTKHAFTKVLFRQGFVLHQYTDPAVLADIARINQYIADKPDI